MQLGLNWAIEGARLKDEGGFVKLRRTIVLVGLMGAGKSSVGKRLSEILDAPYFDSDDEICSAAGMSVPEIFSSYGEAEFRRGENAVLKRLVSGPPAVVSTGGGAFMNADNREAISQAGTSVWLDVALEVLWSRIQDKPGRPLLATENPKETLSNLLKEREPVYKLADVAVTSTFQDSHDDVARNIIKTLQECDAKTPSRAVFSGEL